ncbi:MAG: helix-turn-helix transcriptional regulator [Nostoc sp.]|uniref:helix-turn-helix domain-containing protein n=1 Tax=Nostoc sp. TaxID=1180 RepID=UPI002FF4EDB9
MVCHPILALTPKEKTVAALVRDGLTNRAIAEATWTGTRTVESQIRQIMRKLNAKNRTQVMLILDGHLKTNAEIELTFTNTCALLRAKVRRLKNLGYDKTEIAKMLDVTISCVYQILRRLGYYPRT